MLLAQRPESGVGGEPQLRGEAWLRADQAPAHLQMAHQKTPARWRQQQPRAPWQPVPGHRWRAVQRRHASRLWPWLRLRQRVPEQHREPPGGIGMLSSGGGRVGLLLGEALGNCISLDSSPSREGIGDIRLRGWWSGCHGWAGSAGRAA